jgi:hypothetical protein
MLIGYARTSTMDQKAGIEAQLRELAGAGCEKVFQEQVSSVDFKERQQLDAAVDWARDGDTLIVTKLDRLARSVKHLHELVDTLNAKGVALRIINLGIDTGTATGKLMLTVLGGIAEFEREIMFEGRWQVSRPPADRAGQGVGSAGAGCGRHRPGRDRPAAGHRPCERLSDLGRRGRGRDGNRLRDRSVYACRQP